jgi:hypothetical protein
MKNFNVVFLSDDSTMKMSYFYSVKADNENEAISKATQHFINRMSKHWQMSIEDTENECQDYLPQIFDIEVID